MNFLIQATFHDTLKDSILKLHNTVEIDKSEKNVLNDHEMLFYFHQKNKLKKKPAPKKKNVDLNIQSEQKPK